MSGCVLILTQVLDPHSDFVISALNRRSVPIVRFHTFDYPLRSKLRVTYPADPDAWGLEYNGRQLRWQDVKAVYYRKPEPFDLPPELNAEQRQFAFEECRTALGGIIRSLDCLFVNHPEKIVAGNYKPHQLAVAQERGLTVPRTLITNDPDDLAPFFDRCDGRVVYKTLTSPIVRLAPGDSRVVFTSRVAEADLARSDRIHNGACMFQELITKRHEIRVTVVRDRVFASRINSQADPRSALDFRAHYPGLTYGVESLPREVAEGCMRLVRQFGLVFGTMDLVVSDRGDYVFLDLNPNGQWAFAAEEVTTEITDALADTLEDAVATA